MPRDTLDPLRSKKLNIRLLTEAREEYANSKVASFVFEETNMIRKNRQNTFRLNSRKNMVSTKTLRNGGRKQGCLLSISTSKLCKRTDIIKDQILNSIQVSWLTKKYEEEEYNNEIQKLIERLGQCFSTCQSMLENLYSYRHIEKYVRQIAEMTRKFISPSLQFYMYCNLAFLLFIYDSYSLTIFYLDRALKIYTNKKKYRFQRKLQISAFYYSAKVFVQRQQYENAKNLAYMFLRKAWLYGDFEEELNAYDLLGQIEMEIGNVQLSKYFHHRMCKGALESKEISQKIMVMSNNQFRRQSQEKVEFFVGESIHCFADRDQQIIQIIEKHFKSEAEQHSVEYQKGKNRLIYTHRSPNRNFKNYRLLQRGMIQPKQSSEIHFIKPRNLKSIRKIINEMSGFIFQLKKELNFEKKYHQYYEETNEENSSIFDM